MPPAPVTGVKLATPPTESALLAKLSVVPKGPFTVSANDLLSVEPRLSVTVTLKVAAADVAAVPEIVPSVVLNDRPDGRAVSSAKVRGVVPPVAVTGLNGVTAMPAVSTGFAIASVVITAGLTVRLKVLLDVALALSVTVTV